jgi:hypothetical protein
LAVPAFPFTDSSGSLADFPAAAGAGRYACCIEMEGRTMRRSLFLAVFVLLASAPARAQTAPDAARFIASLADARADAATPGDLSTLLRLQLAARRFAAAEATIERLAERYRAADPDRLFSLVPWRIYARAMRHEGEGLSSPAALARAFASVYAPLSDRDAAEVMAWYNPSMDRLRQAQTEAAAACANVAVDQCPAAAQLVAARQSVTVWDYLLPASQPLIRADLDRRYLVEDQLLVPAADGAEVAAILIRPRGAPAARLTSLLAFTIYARDDWAMADAAKMAAHGYAGMVAYSRGKGRGAGAPVPYRHDGADAAAVIEWLAARPWSDGRVGMFSGSYNASTQWAAARRRPPALRAIATHASNAPGTDTPMQGQVFQSFVYPWPLYTTERRGLDEANYGDRARWEAISRIWYRTGRPYREMDLIDGHPNPHFRAWLDHPGYDDFWRRLGPAGAEFAAIDIPVFVQTGYYDGGMVGALHYMREHLRHRPDADHRLLIGPYHHFAMGAGVQPVVDGYPIDQVARINLQAIRMQWFDHVLRGAPLPELLRDRVNFQVMGANRWRHVPTLAAMAERRRRLYLTGARDGERLRFGDAAQRGGPAPELRVDFADRSDIDHQVPDGAIDRRSALVFATAPLAAAQEIVGGFSGRFEVVINKRDFDLSIALYEQRADGSYFPLHAHLAFLGRASFMADRSRRTLLRPGRVERLAFESQMITARRLEAGSRIVAVVAVPKQPGIQINYGTGGDVSAESIADAGAPLRVRWMAGSWLEIGLRDAEAVVR